MMLKLKLQYFGHLMRRVDSLEKTLMLGGMGGKRRKGTTEDEMAGWHHWLDGHETEWTLGVGDGQGGLVCRDSWGRKESDTSERLIWSVLLQLESGPLFGTLGLLQVRWARSCLCGGWGWGGEQVAAHELFASSSIIGRAMKFKFLFKSLHHKKGHLELPWQ